MTRTAKATSSPAGASLHQTIRGDIERKIASGLWPPGHRVPSEHELMAHYRCSRMTVSKAISGLAEAGLVTRNRRAGTLVAAPPVERAVMDIQDFASDAKRSRQPYAFEMLARQVELLGAAEAARLDLPAGTEVLRLECLHRIAARPMALEKRLIVLAAVPQARDERFERLPPGSWLLAEVPWTAAEHTVCAANADARTARLLAMPMAAACLILERRTWRNGSAVTVVQLIHPGDRYNFVGRFSPFHAGSGSLVEAENPRRLRAPAHS